MGDKNHKKDASPFNDVLEKHRPDLKSYEELYKHFHQNPEISTLEHETSKRIVKELDGFNSRYKDALDIRHPIGGTGVIAICKNGEGHTILLRADIDALPVTEKTKLPYASEATQKDVDGVTKGTMHACGHDFHITSMLAVADTLLSARDTWSGTIVFLFQPAEERGVGAKLMVDDGLYTKHGCPKPDLCLGQHVFPYRAGTVHTRSGAAMSAADSYKITIHGRGGHGSQPHSCIDPVVIASHIVVRLQTIVSREVPPDETAVVTVGSLQSGSTVNVISDMAVLQVNIRSVTTYWRKVLIDGLFRTVKAECEIGRCPKPPEFEKLTEFPLTLNDEKVTETVEKQFGRYFGSDHRPGMKPVLGSEDFSILGSSIDVPYMFWFWGGYDPGDWDKREKEGSLNEIPSNHSPFFAPVIQPTLKTGVDAMIVAALSFVGRNKDQ